MGGFFLLDKVGKLVGGGCVINGAYLSSFKGGGGDLRKSIGE